MPRKRTPERDEAFRMYKESGGKMTLREIAKKLGVPEKTIAAWKSKDKWDGVLFKENTEYTEKIRSTTKKLTPNVEQKQVKDLALEVEELNEKQQLFCLYYIKCFNATKAALKAGYDPHSAHVQGCQLLKNPKIIQHIKRLKGEITDTLMLDATDVLREYIKIAFTDISDFVKFGRRKEQVIGMYGPVTTKTKVGDKEIEVPLMQDVNYIDLNSSETTDNTVIAEIGIDKKGVKIKLADKMKALDKLAEYFDLFPEKFKREIELQKLELLKAKDGNNEGVEMEDDGFIDALRGEASKVWEENKDG